MTACHTLCIITIGAEGFRCAEVLLLPDVIGTVCTLSLPPQRGRLSLDYDTQLKSTAKIDKNHNLPDRTINTVGADRFRCVKVLFQPFPRIPDSTILRRLHPQRTVRLVVLSYGTTLFQGIFEGMTKELLALSLHDEDQDVCFTKSWYTNVVLSCGTKMFQRIV